MLSAYSKYMGGVDHLSQVKKTYGFDKMILDRPFFSFLIVLLIMPTFFLYRHNCKLFDMPPKELLEFRTELVNLLIRQST